jgi:hypothetical protein
MLWPHFFAWFLASASTPGSGPTDLPHFSPFPEIRDEPFFCSLIGVGTNDKPAHGGLEVIAVGADLAAA